MGRNGETNQVEVAICFQRVRDERGQSNGRTESERVVW